jgi:cobalt-zinc-cadmium efflux system membrane fusion protein
VTSPIAGRVVAQSVTLGEMVEPASVLFTVMDLAQVQVAADIYEKDLARVSAGQSVEVRVESFPGRVFTGTVRSVSEALDPQSRTAQLRCVVRNEDRALKPEMFATVTIITAKRAEAVLVPRQAVLDDGAKKVVFTPCLDCEEDKAAGRSVCGSFDKVEVKLGPGHGDRWR